MLVPVTWQWRRVNNALPTIQQLTREMNQLLSDTTQPREDHNPAVNVELRGDGAVLTAKLPGLDAGQIDVTVISDTITISGRRDGESLTDDESYHRQERPRGQFSRSFQLPFTVDSSKVDARYERGILRVKLPRTESQKAKRIVVTS